MKDEITSAPENRNTTTADATPTIATGGFVFAEIAETGQHIRIHCSGPDGKTVTGYLLTVPKALSTLRQQLLEIEEQLLRPSGDSMQ